MSDEQNNSQELVEEKEQEEKGEEQLLDDDGNPMNPEDLIPKEPQNPLKKDLLQKSLSKLSKTYDGLSYAFIVLNLQEKELDDIGNDIGEYQHLRDINVSNNKITHVNPIRNIPYLVRLDASKNEIKDVKEFYSESDKLQFLQKADFNTNKINELPEMHTPALIELNFEANAIKNCINYRGLPNLVKLNLKQNKLKDCIGLANMPNLEVIYLNENQIKSLKGLENLPSLRKLRLANNKLETYDYIPDLPSLEKIDVKENQVTNVKQFGNLKFPRISKINVLSNPCSDEIGGGMKTEILILFEDFDIKAINKEEVTKEDIHEAKNVKNERIQKEIEVIILLHRKDLNKSDCKRRKRKKTRDCE
jgi:Leucine-rich repeat (LRR) protein